MRLNYCGVTEILNSTNDFKELEVPKQYFSAEELRNLPVIGRKNEGKKHLYIRLKDGSVFELAKSSSDKLLIRPVNSEVKHKNDCHHKLDFTVKKTINDKQVEIYSQSIHFENR